MAEMQQTVDSIASKVDKLSKNGWTQSREVVPSEMGRLPGGIERGVARLTGYKIGETDDKDKTPYVRFSGVVELPVEFQGERFVKTVYIGDSQYHSINEQLDKLSADVQALRIETRGTKFKDLDGLLKKAASVKRAFMFHTWKPDDGDRVSNFIDPPSRKLEEFPDMEPGKAATKAATESAPPPARSTRQFGNKAASAPKEAEPEQTSDTFLDEIMDNDTSANSDALPDFGEDNLPDFDTAESQETQEWVPAVGDIGMMKTKKGPLEVQLTKVDLKKKTFSAKSMSSGQEAHNLSFDLLIVD